MLSKSVLNSVKVKSVSKVHKGSLKEKMNISIWTCRCRRTLNCLSSFQQTQRCLTMCSDGFLKCVRFEDVNKNPDLVELNVYLTLDRTWWRYALYCASLQLFFVPLRDPILDFRTQ